CSSLTTSGSAETTGPCRSYPAGGITTRDPNHCANCDVLAGSQRQLAAESPFNTDTKNTPVAANTQVGRVSPTCAEGAIESNDARVATIEVHRRGNRNAACRKLGDSGSQRSRRSAQTGNGSEPRISAVGAGERCCAGVAVTTVACPACRAGSAVAA